MAEPSTDDDDLIDEVSRDQVADTPGDAADPQGLIDTRIPEDIRSRYEIYSYRSAAVILSEGHPRLFAEICDALRNFSITTEIIRTAGGNESDIPKLFSRSLRPMGWRETVIQGDLLIQLISREIVGYTKAGKAKTVQKKREFKREKYLDGHKVDYVKDRVAFDLEWNSKDQTFDRDLYAFSAFAQCGVIDVGVLVTRGYSLGPLISSLGPSLNKNGDIERKRNGTPRLTAEKYGASTTWMGKLIYRLNAGRNGACPVLVVGITPKCVSDWVQPEGIA